MMLAEARELISERLGLDFPARREQDLERAVAGHSPAILREQPTSGPDWRALISALTVRESYFFRDTAPLERALAELVPARRDAKRLAVWSAGCAAGEEPYTLAMLLRAMVGADCNLTILGTDLDGAALELALEGRYGEWALRETPPWARRLHFRECAPKRYELSPQTRAMVAFAPLNLAADGFPGTFDLIVCRNVLMYFTAAARERTVRRLEAALAPGGRLVLSPLDAPALVVPQEQEPEPREAPAPRVDVRERAREAADRGRLRAARALCREALREQPLDAGVHLLLAAVEEEAGDFDAAISALRRAIYTAPDAPAAHFRLGGLLVRAGDHAGGRRSLATAAGLLASQAPETLVPGGDGLTAGRLLAAAQAQLEPVK